VLETEFLLERCESNTLITGTKICFPLPVITVSMEKSPSEANSHSASQEILRLL